MNLLAVLIRLASTAAVTQGSGGYRARGTPALPQTDTRMKIIPLPARLFGTGGVGILSEIFPSDCARKQFWRTAWRDASNDVASPSSSSTPRETPNAPVHHPRMHHLINYCIVISDARVRAGDLTDHVWETVRDAEFPVH